MAALFYLAILLSLLNQEAHADIWGYTDEKGGAHFSNERVDARYEVFYRSAESFNTDQPTGGPSESFAVAGNPVQTSKITTYFEISPGFKAIKHHLREASSTHNIDFELLQALIATESGFNSVVISPKGAVGLMQLMPATAARFGVSDDKHSSVEKKLADPVTNIKAGTRYLSYLIRLFPGQLELALAAYNAGEGTVQRAGNKIPNFKETQNYVKTVMQLYEALKPPVVVPVKKAPPVRVRMELYGGASNRGNMISSFQAIAVPPPFKTETD